MNRHQKLWDDYRINQWVQWVNAGSWIILSILAVVSFLCFLSICGIKPK